MSEPNDQTFVERAYDVVDKLDLPLSLFADPEAASKPDKLLATNATLNAYARHMAIVLLSLAKIPLGTNADPNSPFNFVTGRILDAAKNATKSCAPKRAN